ncbi:type II toxin-antitoxin system Phd/YefM family antitoxin [Candidatus Manganitrophus noduliformans]|nr:type II toxin-antitoxin system Phd/YefM family antitoxin [Candidatus Manganitrophus noduliformans]
MIKEATATTVRRNLGDLIKRIQHRHDSILVTKAGKPVAAIVDIELFNKMRALESEFDRLVGGLQGAFKGETIETVEKALRKAKTVSRRRGRR